MSNLVRMERLELSRVSPLEPKSSASTNSATFANDFKALQEYRCYFAVSNFLINFWITCLFMFKNIADTMLRFLPIARFEDQLIKRSIACKRHQEPIDWRR